MGKAKSLKPIWEAAERALQLAQRILQNRGEKTVAAEPTRHRRLVATASLLRRSIVTTDGVRALLLNRILEPATAACRTLADIEVAMRLVTDDETDAMSERLIAFEYLNRYRYQHKHLSDGEMRRFLESVPGEKDKTKELAKSWQDQFEGEAFAAIRGKLINDLDNSRGWHGKGAVQDAFAAVGMAIDYVQDYGLSSHFVHGINIEFDMQGFEEGKPMLKPLRTQDGKQLQSCMGVACWRLYSTSLRFWSDKAFEKTPTPVSVLELQTVAQALMDLFGGDTELPALQSYIETSPQ
jgi:hypothetical protein